MISKFLNKLKSILFKTSVSSETPLKKAQKTNKPSKAPKAQKAKKPKKVKSKKGDSKKGIDNLTTLPGVGAKSAKALYEAGFKTTKSIISAKEKELLSVPGIGINLVKKLKNLK